MVHLCMSYSRYGMLICIMCYMMYWIVDLLHSNMLTTELITYKFMCSYATENIGNNLYKCWYCSQISYLYSYMTKECKTEHIATQEGSLYEVWNISEYQPFNCCVQLTRSLEIEVKLWKGKFWWIKVHLTKFTNVFHHQWFTLYGKVKQIFK